MKTRPVAVIGAGIGGLAAAVALQRRGIEVTVYERAPSLRAGGGALILWTNAMKALASIGLDRAVFDAGCAIEETELRAWDGRVLWTIPFGELGRRFGAPTVVVHRARLLELLAEAAGKDVIRYGCSCVGFAESERDIDITFEGHTRVHAPALVGADGINSTIRAQLVGVEPLRAHAQEGWSGIVELDHHVARPGTSVATVGRGPRFAFSHIGGGRIYWLATVPNPLGRGRANPSTKEELLQLYADCHAPVFDLIDRTPHDALIRNEVVDRPAAAHWSRGRATLLGDAAHPMTPDLGQGACQAIEDAICLARCLAIRPGGIENALAEYERLRRPRASQIQEMARLTARWSIIDDPIMCALRDHVFASIFPVLARREMEWVLDHRE